MSRYAASDRRVAFCSRTHCLATCWMSFRPSVTAAYSPAPSRLGGLAFRRRGHIVILRDSERRERCSVTNVKFLKNVMKMHLDGAIRDVQSAANFLVRQSFGHQTNDLTLAVC